MSKRLILMRGLPFAGKSYRANQILAENGGGLIFSTDEYWYKMVEPDQPEKYSFKPNYLAHAHYWNQQRCYRAIEMGEPLIVVDNTNTMLKEFCCSYARYALCQDYEVSIEEPTSDRWLEIKALLANKNQNRDKLKEWALKLEEGSQGIHNVPAFAIERMMWRWEEIPNLTEALEKCEREHKPLSNQDAS